jgi:L-amino acid N-acyltransferase YncA
LTKRCFIARTLGKGTIVEFRRATSEDISAILDVQAANFIDNLDDAERQDGFLSVELTRKQLDEMANSVGVMVATDGVRLAGYLCASECDFNRQFPLLAGMLQRFASLTYHERPLNSYRLFIYGPVCLDQSYRGRGLLQGLYEALRNEVAGRFEVGVAFVAENNPHSLRAHVDCLGMVRVGDFRFGGQGYHILAFGVSAERHQNHTQSHQDG